MNIKSKNLIKNNYNKFIVIGAFIGTILFIYLSSFSDSHYNFQIGEVSAKRIKSTIKLENIVATNRNREIAIEAADKLLPVVERNISINDEVIENINNIFVVIDRYRVLISLEDEEDSRLLEIEEIKQVLNMSEANLNIISSLEEIDYDSLKDLVLRIAYNVLEVGFTELDPQGINLIRDRVDTLFLSQDLKEIVYNILVNNLKGNIVTNEEATNRAREEIEQDYQIVYYLKGETIVNEGEILTEEAFTALEQLGYINIDYSKKLIPMIGKVLISAFVFLIFVVYLNTYHKELLKDSKNKNYVTLLLTIYLLLMAGGLILGNINFHYVPIFMVTFIVAVVFEFKLALIFNALVTVLCLSIYRADLTFFIFFVLSGSVIACMTNLLKQRSKFLRIVLIILISNVSLATGVYAVLGVPADESLNIILLNIGIVSIVYIVLGFGSLPIWEGIFTIITPHKLMELANPNNALLRKLVEEAPGTYHHSLIVANLASAAADSIGANADIARVGAYYHDIGKLKNPKFFYENIVGENPHDNISAKQSMEIITEHSIYGLEMAKKYKLPQVISDIVVQHQGNTVVRYFYAKHKKENPDSELTEDDFRYEDNRPVSKESSIVMLADTIEAAVRSIMNSGESPEEVEVFIRKLIKAKLDDGQLNYSILTLGDLELIINSFLKVFQGMYHKRIKYPEDNEK